VSGRRDQSDFCPAFSIVMPNIFQAQPSRLFDAEQLRRNHGVENYTHQPEPVDARIMRRS
jgi:hypothetical protein